jgi:hypothetical protein
VLGKKAHTQDANLAISLKEMGFGDDANLAKYLANPLHQKVQLKFDQVFKNSDATRTIVGFSVGNSKSTEVDNDQGMEINLDFSIPSEQDGEFVMSDKDLELDDLGELSISVEPNQALSLNDELDLSLDGDEIDTSENLKEDLDISLDPDSTESTETELRLGDSGGLEEDVMAKLAEIEEIMVADATQTMMHPIPGRLKETTNHAIAEKDLNLSNDSEDDLDLSNEDSLSEEGSDALSLGAETLLEEDNDLNFAADDNALSLGDESLDENSPESLFTRNDIELGAEVKNPGKKVLPSAPSLQLDDLAGDAALAFAIESEMIDPRQSFSSPSPKIDASSLNKQSRKNSQLTLHGESPQEVSVTSSKEERTNYQAAVGNYNAELERLQATLNHLRSDREELLKKIEKLEEDKLSQQRLSLTMRAELDEKKIEIQLMKKRMTEDSQDIKYQLELEQERRKLAEERAREYQNEIQTLQQKVKLEVKKVSSRESELGQKLELLKSDAETQIRHRDMKILELKRKIDAMEFEMDTLNSLEQKSMGDKTELENKLDKAIKTLRTAIGILEVDDPKLATLEKLKKNLDV